MFSLYVKKNHSPTITSNFLIMKHLLKSRKHLMCSFAIIYLPLKPILIFKSLIIVKVSIRKLFQFFFRFCFFLIL